MEEEHTEVPHPTSLIEPVIRRFKVVGRASDTNGKLLSWITDHVLASMLMFDIALLVPLLVFLPPFTGLKDVVIILSSNWIQLWALFALQRSSNQADVLRQAKADADHQALTHIANTLDSLSDWMLCPRPVQEGGPPLNN